MRSIALAAVFAWPVYSGCNVSEGVLWKQWDRFHGRAAANLSVLACARNRDSGGGRSGGSQCSSVACGGRFLLVVSLLAVVFIARVNYCREQSVSVTAARPHCSDDYCRLDDFRLCA